MLRHMRPVSTLLLFTIASALALIGCSSGGSSTPPPPISVSFPQGNSAMIRQGQSVGISATTSNDPSAKGVSWSVSGPGTLSKQTSTSAEYDAPPSVASNEMATVIAASIADPSKTAAFTVTVTFPPVALVRLSTDTLTNSLGQHATEVEPDTLAFGSTIVATFQVGRIFGGASSAIGFAASTDSGTTWTSGLLPGVTTNFQGGGVPFNSASDPAVAYDAKHGQWLIASIAVNADPVSGDPLTEQVLVNRSVDGVHWSGSIAVNPVSGYDKDWVVCDSTATSPFFGHCYVQWRDNKGLMNTSTSLDGGLTWQSPVKTADNANGGAGQPLVQPNGTVVSPMLERLSTRVLSFTSTDGGASWSATVPVATISDHTEAGNLRMGPIPSAEIDGAGTVYVVWSDCRFRANCSANDLVLSTSSDGTNWTAPARVPIDLVTSTVDHFLPGLAVDRSTSGAGAHLTLTYYYYPASNCGSSCDLYIGYISSPDGGQTWSAPVPVVGPMKLDWLPKTGGNVSPGSMVADYISTSYVNSKPFGVFIVAAANNGTTFDQATFTTAQPMLPPPGPLRFSSAHDKPVRNAKSDHPPRDLYGESEKPPRRYNFR